MDIHKDKYTSKHAIEHYPLHMKRISYVSRETFMCIRSLCLKYLYLQPYYIKDIYFYVLLIHTIHTLIHRNTYKQAIS